jgi:hypothetical protein
MSSVYTTWLKRDLAAITYTVPQKWYATVIRLMLGEQKLLGAW